MTRCFVADTYAWIEYFSGNEAYAELFQESELKTPAIVVAELSRVLRRKRASPEKIAEAMKVVLEKSVILALDFERAGRVGEVCEAEKLDFADAIAYSYASEKCVFLTGDEHFRGKKNVLLIK